jgi:ketol-acid reductoisomerase
VPKPDHPPTVAFTRFCVQWLAEREPRAVPNANSLHTKGNGWLWFTSPSRLVYKAAHGRVDLYVGEHGFKGTADDLASAVAAGWGPESFAAAVDTSGNPVLRFEHPRTMVYSQDGVPEDVTGVIIALKAVITAVRWLAEQGGAIRFPTV